MLYQLGKAEAKVARESMRRSGRAEADAGPLVTELFPDKHLQERYYSVLPFLARHGFELFDTIYANVHWTVRIIYCFLSEPCDPIW